jgi:hypothetical protein
VTQSIGRMGVFLWLGIAAGIGYVASLLGYRMTAARYLHSIASVPHPHARYDGRPCSPRPRAINSRERQSP